MSYDLYNTDKPTNTVKVYEQLCREVLISANAFKIMYEMNEYWIT